MKHLLLFVTVMTAGGLIAGGALLLALSIGQNASGILAGGLSMAAGVTLGRALEVITGW